MSKLDTWNRFRKRLAPVAFVLAIVILATQTCGSDVASVEFRFDSGAAQSRVAKLHVDVYPEGSNESVAYFDGEPGPRNSWKLQLDAGDYRLGFRVTLRDGSVRSFDRTVIAKDGAVIRVNLERSLQK